MATATQLPQSFADTLAQIQSNISGLTKKIQTEGITNAEGKVLYPPISATDLTQNQNVSLPAGGTPLDTTGVQTNAMAGVAGAKFQAEFQKAEQERLAKIETERVKSQAEQQAKLVKLEEITSGQTAQEYATAQGVTLGIPAVQSKIDAIIPEIDTLNKSLIDLETRKQDALAVAGNQLADVPISIVTRQQQKISDDFDRQKATVSMELAAKTALMNAYQGRIDSAQTAIKDAVGYMQYDTNKQLTGITTFMSQNQDYINSLSNDEKDILNNIQDYWKTTVAKEESDYNEEWNMVLDIAEKNGNANLTAADLKRMTLDEVRGWYSKALATVPTTVGGIPTIKNINGVDMQWNGTTWEPVKTTLNQPRDYQDTELKTLAQAYKDTEKLSYEAAIADIDATVTIQNKDKAKEITAEVYGKNKTGGGKSLIQKAGEFFSQPVPLPIKETNQTAPIDKLTSWLKGLVKSWNPQTGLQKPKK